MSQLGSLPSLADKFQDEKLYHSLAQRCAIPNSVAVGLHALVTDGLLGTALRQRWNGTMPSPEIQGETHQVGDPNTVAGRDPPGGSDEPGAERPIHEALASPEERSPKRRRKAASRAYSGTSAAVSTDLSTLPLVRSTPEAGNEVLDVSLSTASLQARLSAFDNTTPPSFRLFARQCNRRHLTSQTESVIIRPTETNRLLFAGSKVEDEKQDPRSSIAAGPAEYVSSLVAPHKLVVRLAASGLHAVGGRRRDAPSTHDSSTREVQGDSSYAASQAQPQEVTQVVETLASSTLESLSRTILCPTRLLPVSSVNGVYTTPPPQDQRTDSLALDFVATSNRLFLPAGASDSDHDAAKAVCREAQLITSAQIDVGSLEDTRVCDVLQQHRNGPIWLLHNGDCVHSIMITQVRYQPTSEGSAEGFPRTLTVPSAALRNPMTSMLLKRRFHSDAISPMVCSICAAWPGQAIIVGGADVRIGASDRRHIEDGHESLSATEGDVEVALRGVAEQAIVCCGKCWAACGGSVKSNDDSLEAALETEVSPASSPPKTRRKGKVMESAAKPAQGKGKGKHKEGGKPGSVSHDSKAKAQIDLLKQSDAEVWDALPIL